MRPAVGSGAAGIAAAAWRFFPAATSFQAAGHWLGACQGWPPVAPAPTCAFTPLLRLVRRRARVAVSEALKLAESARAANASDDE